MARAKGPFDAVQFTKESAERIANVVRRAELTPAAGVPLEFDKRFYDNKDKNKHIRVATFSGSWPAGSVKTVTLKYAPTATASVTNLTWPIDLSGYLNEDCIVGKEGTNWWLLVPRLEAKTAIMVTETTVKPFVSGISHVQGEITYLSDMSVSASLSTSDCTISVSTSKSSATLSYVASISKSTATAAFISASYTSAFIRVRVP
jgi:hypothetical protein